MTTPNVARPGRSCTPNPIASIFLRPSAIGRHAGPSCGRRAVPGRLSSPLQRPRRTNRPVRAPSAADEVPPLLESVLPAADLDPTVRVHWQLSPVPSSRGYGCTTDPAYFVSASLQTVRMHRRPAARSSGTGIGSASSCLGVVSVRLCDAAAPGSGSRSEKRRFMVTPHSTSSNVAPPEYRFVGRYGPTPRELAPSFDCFESKTYDSQAPAGASSKSRPAPRIGVWRPVSYGIRMAHKHRGRASGGRSRVPDLFSRFSVTVPQLREPHFKTEDLTKPKYLLSLPSQDSEAQRPGLGSR